MLLRETERQGKTERLLFTDRQNASNLAINMLCHFANLLESRPCCLSSCAFMNHFRSCLSVSNL